MVEARPLTDPPVIEDAVDELLLVLERMDQIVALDTVDACGAGDIVDIEIGDVRRDDIPALILDGMMTETDGDSHLLAPLELGRKSVGEFMKTFG